MEAVAERATVRWPAGPDWTGMTAAILASGPSMSVPAANAVRDWRAAAARRRVITINTTFQLAPWADVLYACDAKWWDLHIEEVRALGCGGDLWSIEAGAKDRHGVRVIESQRGPGLARSPGVINQGSHSGYQAIGFAWQCGAARILLLGFDMHEAGGRAHWHADHPQKIRRSNPYALWIRNYGPLASDLKAEGCEVINCTPNSALGAFPRVPLATALEDHP